MRFLISRKSVTRNAFQIFDIFTIYLKWICRNLVSFTFGKQCAQTNSLKGLPDWSKRCNHFYLMLLISKGLWFKTAANIVLSIFTICKIHLIYAKNSQSALHFVDSDFKKYHLALQSVKKAFQFLFSNIIMRQASVYIPTEYCNTFLERS